MGVRRVVAEQAVRLLRGRLEQKLSPDSQRLVFSSVRDDLQNADIWVMDADGSNQVSIYDTGGWDFDPVWSPDGEHIVFWSAGAGGVIVNPDGSGRRGVGGGLAFPSWSPDSKQIVFTTWNGTSTELILFTSGGSFVEVLTNDFAFDTMPAWSPILP